ncbi:hypothetical protein E2C01_055386 [Portunus trituberculatus]|uniref:Uncharacterized protein n=1 Tax=Portunus trituberculatus TaxID=210409 RepID=A0A5B7GUM7_PORTR|nr:hypothetical protein [Portunus trituberculatus]
MVSINKSKWSAQQIRQVWVTIRSSATKTGFGYYTSRPDQERGSAGLRHNQPSDEKILAGLPACPSQPGICKCTDSTPCEAMHCLLVISLTWSAKSSALPRNSRWLVCMVPGARQERRLPLCRLQHWPAGEERPHK